MRKNEFLRGSSLLLAVASAGSLFGCANYEVNSGRGNIPGYYIRTEMQQSDRAVEAARAAGKDRLCPAEFKQVQDAENNAYDVFRACHTEEGAALAKEVTARANALCPPVAVLPAPTPVPVAVVPVPVAAPTDQLTATPASIFKGESAVLNWTSANAVGCRIDPGVGAVQTEGSVTVTPEENAAYTLVCRGAGGTAKSEAAVSVLARPVVKPAPVAEPAPAPVAAPVPVVVQAVQAEAPSAAAVIICKPAVIDVHFATNKWDIQPQFHQELKKLAGFLNEFPKATGTISGHTDSVGSKAANMKLSQRRADSVRSYLVEKFGISEGRIKAVGYGPTRPIADNKTVAGKKKNRRIESHFICDTK